MTKEFDKQCFFKMLGIVLLFTLFLFPYNYCSDIYNVMDVGYIEYAKEWFAPAGRTVGMCVLYLFDVMKIPIDMYICIMKILAIFIAAYTIYTFYNMVLDAIQNKEEIDSSKKKYIFIATIITFLNMATYQYFYYAESAVMLMGVMLTVLAVKMIIKDNNRLKYLKAFVFLFIAMNCYQSTILFFMPATLLFLGIKKDKLIKIIGEIIKLSLLVGICLLLGYYILQSLTEYFEIIPYRENIIAINKETVVMILRYLIFQNHDEFGYNFTYLIINVFLIVFTLILKKKFIKKKKLVAVSIIIFIIMSAFLQTWGIVSAVNYYFADRIQFAYLSTVGLCALFFVMYTDILDYKIIKKMAYIFLIIFLIYMIGKANYLSILNRYVRMRDNLEGKAIAEAIERYEEFNEYEITQILYCFDNELKYNCIDVEPHGEPTFRILGSPWVLGSALKYYVGYDIETAYCQGAFTEIFDDREWDWFDERQMKFEENVLYLSIY